MLAREHRAAATEIGSSANAVKLGRLALRAETGVGAHAGLEPHARPRSARNTGLRGGELKAGGAWGSGGVRPL